MSFDKNAGGTIPLAEGATMTAAYRTKYPTQVKANYLGAEWYTKLLNQEGCVGIRIFHAVNSEGEMDVVLVGVDENGDDMLDMVVDRSRPCPNLCGAVNVLNS